MFKIQNQKIKYPDKTNITCSFACDPHILPHKHDDSLEIIYCISGRVTVRCSNDRCSLDAGEFYIVNYDELHCIYSDAPCMFASIHIDLHNTTTSWEDCQKSFFSLMENSNLSHYHHLQDLLITILILFCSQDAPDPVMCSKLVSTLIGYLSDHFNWFSNDDIPPSSREIYRDRFVRVVRYCYDNYTHKITLNDLAEIEHVNQNYFSQVMKKSNYRGFTNMLNYMRCWMAERQLIESDLSISNISYMNGFSDPKYFYASFEKHWDMTPGQLRNWYREFIRDENHYKEAQLGDAAGRLSTLLMKHHMAKMTYSLTDQSRH